MKNLLVSVNIGIVFIVKSFEVKLIKVIVKIPTRFDKKLAIDYKRLS
jgi:hypothetical protein